MNFPTHVVKFPVHFPKFPVHFPKFPTHLPNFPTHFPSFQRTLPVFQHTFPVLISDTPCRFPMYFCEISDSTIATVLSPHHHYDLSNDIHQIRLPRGPNPKTTQVFMCDEDRKFCEDRQQTQADTAASTGPGEKQCQADLSQTIIQQYCLVWCCRSDVSGKNLQKKKVHKQMDPNYVYRLQRSN